MAKGKTVVIASDHNGSQARLCLDGHFLGAGIEFVDIGPVDKYKKVDYVDYARQVAHAVSLNSDLCGVLICGTGLGMSIAANRFQGVRASMVTDVDSARKTREHNDSNI